MSESPCFYTGDRYNFNDSIGHRLFGVMMMFRREADARMARHGLTDAQWKPLWMIQSGRATTAIELARESGIDAGAVTRMLDRLEAKGLVERVRSESDRRVVHLKLTEAGQAAAAHIPHVLASVNNDFLRGFSERDFQTLRKLLDRMADNGRTLQGAEEPA